jgi:phospholipid/cholesterol/gamma-HCH transport system permease protein
VRAAPGRGRGEAAEISSSARTFGAKLPQDAAGRPDPQPTRPAVTRPKFKGSPLDRGIRELGAIGVLTRRTVVSVFKPPYNYGPELAEQFAFGLRMAWFPLVISAVAFTYGPAGIQAAGFLNLFGAIDRLGGLFAQIVMREFAPLVCAIVMAGVVGTAITADLGARKIRDELDALHVLGIDTVKSLVAPRFIGLMALTSLLNVFALLLGTMGGMLVTVANGAPLGPFFNTFFNNATVPEIGASLMKTTIFGGIIAIVCCYKGLNAEGGPEGVGRAVNQAVVISFLAIGVVNFVFTQTLLASYPELSQVR